MNRKLLIAATIAVIGLSSCSAQQRQMYDNFTDNNAVVDTDSTVVTPLPRNEATVTIDIGTPLVPILPADAPCGEPGGGNCRQPVRACGETGRPNCAQPPTPPTTVYTGPPRMQCDDGSFAPQGECPPPADQGPTTTNP